MTEREIIASCLLRHLRTRGVHVLTWDSNGPGIRWQQPRGLDNQAITAAFAEFTVEFHAILESLWAAQREKPQPKTDREKEIEDLRERIARMIVQLDNSGKGSK